MKKAITTLVVLIIAAVFASVAIAGGNRPPKYIPPVAGVANATQVSPVTIEMQDGVTPAQLGISNPATTSVTCWNGNKTNSWGIGDFSVNISDFTHWCAHYNGNVTYRATTVTPVSMFCSHDAGNQFRIAGAANDTTYYVEWDDNSTFHCPFPYLGVNFYKAMALYATSYGSYVMYWTN